MNTFEGPLPSEAALEKTFDRLWPICRSITGDGFRQSLAILSEIAGYQAFEVPTGKRVFDWTIPKEWNIEDAYLEDEAGRRVIDFAKSNLHVVNYSVPVDKTLSLEELQPFLHSLPEQPDAIPYLTSYYKERWGFCLSENQRKALKPGRYHAVIKSRLEKGSLTMAHKLLKATARKSAGEILISTYLCHPSMANNELSGPLVATYLYDALRRLPERRYDYRFVIVPETIGAIAYLARFGGELKRRVKAGLVVTCVGDQRAITYQRSRRGDAEVDRVAEAELAAYGKPHRILDFMPYGSDERQYCSPGFNLPVGSLMRSTYDTYPEYHTSLDDKSCISMAGLRESVGLYLRVVLGLEANRTYKATVAKGEPFYGPRGLYLPMGAAGDARNETYRMMWIVNQSDGGNDLCSIARKAKCSILDLASIAKRLLEAKLLVVASPSRKS